jgi:hypothetical protein
MASVRKSRPVKGDGRGRNARATYAEFMRDLLSGAIQATALHDVTAPDGTVEIEVPTEDGTATVVHTRRRLLSLEYDDPDGSPGASQGGAGTRGRN